MNDYRYYASEYTLSQVNSNIDTLNTNVMNLNNNLVTYCEGFNLLIIVIAIFLSVKFIESFIDKLLNSRK